jgi:hypothetical protein
MVGVMKMPEDVKEFFRRQGKIGAKKRHASLTPERRREIARQAAATRWANAKKRNSKKEPR